MFFFSSFGCFNRKNLPYYDKKNIAEEIRNIAVTNIFANFAQTITKKASMKKETIKNIRIEDFRNVEAGVDYVDEDIVMISDTSQLSYFKDLVRLECMLFAYCTDGTALLEINNKPYLLESGTSIVLLPTVLVYCPPAECPGRLQLLGFSTRFLGNMGELRGKNIETGFYLYNNPILHAEDDWESYSAFELYQQLIRIRIESKSHPCRKQIIHYLMSALFCEIITKINEFIPKQKIKAQREGVSQSTYIFRRFMDKVLSDDGTHRSVTYYADQLCYSPKYLSTIVKEVCGKSPLTIINDHAMKLIKHELKHSELSMKEIADRFDFSNPSFFGKFVKAHVGMSPQEYRNATEEE